uniref:Nudix hydrolase domain-containing protein n=1 Tax=Rhipicephalus sanguineus TaxID=34632 RepID=A0A9D4PAC4_RHISA
MTTPMPKPGPRTSRRTTVEEISAGGIVVDFSHPRLAVAVIARINRAGRIEWCLPKGHLEGTETPAEAARREVEEETGIAGQIICPAGNRRLLVHRDRDPDPQTRPPFPAACTVGDLTVDNDPDQEAIDAAWVPFNDLRSRLSFANERRIVAAARPMVSRLEQ